MWAHMQERAAAAARTPGARPGARARRSRRTRDERYRDLRRADRGAGDARRSASPPTGAPLAIARRPAAPAPRASWPPGCSLLAAPSPGVSRSADGERRGAAAPPVGNGVAAIDPDGDAGRRRSSSAATAPSNIAVGEGAVWVLNSENDTVSRIDPETKAVTRDASSRAACRPTSRRARGRSGSATAAASDAQRHGQRLAVDPRTGRVTRTVKLPAQDGQGALATFNWGFPDDRRRRRRRLGASTPTDSVCRASIPATGRLRGDDRRRRADGIAAGDEGVWVLEGPARSERIDPRTNRVAPEDPRRPPTPSAIAVGAGKVWVHGRAGGRRLADRAGAGARSRGRSTSGAGVDVHRLRRRRGVGRQLHRRHRLADRPAHERRSRQRCPVGAAQALAAGAGGGVGQHRGRGPARARCRRPPAGELGPGGSAPDVLIASDLPLQGPNGAGPRAMADAIRLVLEQPRLQGRQVHASATARATTRPRRPAASRTAGAPRTRTRTRARSGSWR